MTDNIIEIRNRRSWLLIVVFSILTLQVIAGSILTILNLFEVPWYQPLILLGMYSIFLYLLIKGLAWQLCGVCKVIIADNSLTFKKESPLTSTTKMFDLDKVTNFNLRDNSEKEGPLAMLQLVGVADKLSLLMTYDNKDIKLMSSNNWNELSEAKEKIEQSRK